MMPKSKTFTATYTPYVEGEDPELDKILDVLAANTYIPEFETLPKFENVENGIKITPGKHKGSAETPEPYYIIWNK